MMFTFIPTNAPNGMSKQYPALSAIELTRQNSSDTVFVLEVL